jgi:hypothetical protein
MNIASKKGKSSILYLLCIVFLSFFLVLSLTACGNKGSANKAENEAKVEIKLLKDFPKDFMPLYEVLRVNNNQYEVKEEANWVFGKDMYVVEFESKASKAELVDYYKDLLDSVDEKASFDENSFEGLIGEQRISISISDEGFLDALGTTVRISFGVPKAEYSNENKYFTEYPKDLIEQTFVNAAIRYKYLEDYYYDLKQYSVAYQTIEKPEVVVDHFNAKYGGKDKFKAVKDQYGTTFTWIDGEYSCYVRYTDSTGTDMLLLSVQKSL